MAPKAFCCVGSCRLQYRTTVDREGERGRAGRGGDPEKQKHGEREREPNKKKGAKTQVGSSKAKPHHTSKQTTNENKDSVRKATGTQKRTAKVRRKRRRGIETHARSKLHQTEEREGDTSRTKGGDNKGFFSRARCISAGLRSSILLADQRGIEPPPAVCQRHESAAIPTEPRGRLRANTTKGKERGVREGGHCVSRSEVFSR